jgi:hypothetical protein
MYTTEGIPHFPHREPTNAAVESDNCVGWERCFVTLINYIYIVLLFFNINVLTLMF